MCKRISETNEGANDLTSDIYFKECNIIARQWPLLRLSRYVYDDNDQIDIMAFVFPLYECRYGSR